MLLTPLPFRRQCVSSPTVYTLYTISIGRKIINNHQQPSLRSRGICRKALATLLRQPFRRGALMPHVYLNELKLTS